MEAPASLTILEDRKGDIIFQMFHVAKENKLMKLGITRKYQGKVLSSELSKTYSIDYSTI